MTDYGGMGGRKGGRPLREDDAFEMAIERQFGQALRTIGEDSHALAVELWSAMANVSWFNENGDTASYSFRAAGDVIAAVRHEGDYMDWYCSGPYAEISERVAEGLAREGWSGKED